MISMQCFDDIDDDIVFDIHFFVIGNFYKVALGNGDLIYDIPYVIE